jgi:hypothetical protein
MTNAVTNATTDVTRHRTELVNCPGDFVIDTQDRLWTRAVQNPTEP